MDVYPLFLLSIEGYPVQFGFLLMKIHLLAFEVVTIRLIIRQKTKKNLFSRSLHLNAAQNSSGLGPLENKMLNF